MQEKFFTTEQVANILQVHPFTILKFIKQGKLKGIKLGRVYRIKESDINRFLEERMTSGNKKSPKADKKAKEKPKKQELPDPIPPKEKPQESPKSESSSETEESYLINTIDPNSKDDENYYII